MILTFLMGTGQAFCRPFLSLNLSNVSSWLNIGRGFYSRHTTKVMCSQCIKSGSMWCWFMLSLITLTLITLTLIIWPMVVPAGFFKLYITNILGWIVLCCGWGYCPVHYRMFSFIFNLYPLDVSSTPTLVCDNQQVSRHCQMSLGVKIPSHSLESLLYCNVTFFFYS